MGLMISVLVFCVGIIEALSCYEHFQYGVVHCATNLYERARRRSSAFLNYTSRRYRLLCENSIAEDEIDDETQKPVVLDGDQDTLHEIKSNIKRSVKARERKLGKDEKVDIVRKLLERPTRPRAARSISMPELVYTEKDLELTKIINELAIEPIDEINVEIGIEESDSETVAEEFDKLFIESEGGFKDFSVTSNGRVPGVFLDRERSFMAHENSKRCESVNKTEDETEKEKNYESVTEPNEIKGKMKGSEENCAEQIGNGVISSVGSDLSSCANSKDSDKKEENVCLVDNLISDRFNKGPYLKRSVSVDIDISSYFENRSLPARKSKVESVRKSSLQKSFPKIPPSNESTQSSDLDHEIFEKVEEPAEVIEETFEKLCESLSAELPDLINDEEIIKVIDSNDRSQINVEEVDSLKHETEDKVLEELYDTLSNEVVGNDVISETNTGKSVEHPVHEISSSRDEAFDELYENLSTESPYFVSDEELSKVIDNIVDVVISNGISMSNVELSKQKINLTREKGERNVSNEIYRKLANRIVNACLEEIKNLGFEELCRETNYLEMDKGISKTKGFLSKSENSSRDETPFHLLVPKKSKKEKQDGDTSIFLVTHFSDEPNQRFVNYEKEIMPKAGEVKNREEKFDETEGDESLDKDSSQSQRKEISKDTNDLMNFNSIALENSLVEIENESTAPTSTIAMPDKADTKSEDKVAPKKSEKCEGGGNNAQILAITCPNFPAIEYKIINPNQKDGLDECSGKAQEVIPMEWKVDAEESSKNVNTEVKIEQENISKINQETVVDERKGNEIELENLKTESTGNSKVIQERENEETSKFETPGKEVIEKDFREGSIPKEDSKETEVDKTVKENLIEVKEIKIDVEAQPTKDFSQVGDEAKDKINKEKSLVVAPMETEVVEPETEMKVGDQLEKGLEPKLVTRDCGEDLICHVTAQTLSSGGVTEVVESVPGDSISKETVERDKVNETNSESNSLTVDDNVESSNVVSNEPKNLNRIDKSLKEGTEKNAAPEAFWLIFSGEYTKAMSKDWHSGHFSCWQCDEALTGQRYVLRDDHPYCIKCYESVFANVCEECNKIIGIDSKDLSYKDKHWHEACFLCNKCRVSLVDKQFGSKADKIYCGNCYDAQFASRCDGCGEIFRAGTKKMEYKTRQWHEKCFCCCVCKTPIGTKSFIPREQEIYCATCYEEKFATRCVKCNKIITSGGVTYKNEPWHRECFTCTNCNTSLAGQRFTSRDEKPYCADCFGELFAKRCTACSRPITGIGGTRFISFEDRHWHNDCFICASCKTSLVGRGFITDGDDIICPECAKQKLM